MAAVVAVPVPSSRRGAAVAVAEVAVLPVAGVALALRRVGLEQEGGTVARLQRERRGHVDQGHVVDAHVVLDQTAEHLQVIVGEVLGDRLAELLDAVRHHLLSTDDGERAITTATAAIEGLAQHNYQLNNWLASLGMSLTWRDG